jgi:preprotein translocase subunit SecF
VHRLRGRAIAVIAVVAGPAALIAVPALTDFALTLLVGILVGTCSSVFTATPVAARPLAASRRT